MQGSHVNTAPSWRLIWLLAFLALVPGTAETQVRGGGISGHVRSERGEAVTGAVVRITALARVTRSGGDGGFRFEEVPVGTHELSVSAVGFRPVQLVVIVAAGSQARVAVTMERQVALLEDVVVSVSREAQSRAEATAAISVIDAAEIGRAKAHHPADLLSRVPGAWIANLSGEGHTTAIRQPITTKPVYAFLEDGIPTRSTGFFNHNGLYEINLPMAERVEVIKGPGSALHGSDAIGGVINAYTRAPSDQPSANIFVEGGRFGYGRALITASRTWGRDGVRADVNLTRSDGFRPDASYQRQTGTVRWDRAMGSTRLRTVVTWSHIDQPGDGGGNLSEAQFLEGQLLNTAPIALREVVAIRGSSTIEHRAGLSLLSASVFARYNSMDLLPSWQLAFDPQIWALSHRSYGATARARRAVPEWRLEASVGMDAEVSPGRHQEWLIVPERENGNFVRYTEGDLQYDYDVTFWQASPFGQLELRPVDRLRLEFGLRMDNAGYRYDNHLGELQTGRHRRPASTEVSYRRFSPKAGLSLELMDGWHAFASYRAAFRAPSEGQLFRQGQAETTIDLAPVKADNYEAGLRVRFARVTVEGTVYQLDIEDDILTFFDPANGLRTATNAGATRHRGVEVGVAVLPVDAVRLDASMALTRQRYREWSPNPATNFGGNEIELAPRTMGRVGLTWSPAAFRGGYTGVEWIHQGRYAMDPGNEEYHSGFNLLHLSGALPVTAGLGVVGRVQNLTDRRYAETSTFNTAQGKQFRPGSPRTLHLGLQYGWGPR